MEPIKIDWSKVEGETQPSSGRGTNSSRPPFPHSVMDRARGIVNRAFSLVCDEATDQEKAAEAEWWRRRNALVFQFTQQTLPTEPGVGVPILPIDIDELGPLLGPKKQAQIRAWIAETSPLIAQASPYDRAKLEREVNEMKAALGSKKRLADVVLRLRKKRDDLHREATRRHERRSRRTLARALELAALAAPPVPSKAITLAHQELCHAYQKQGRGRKDGAVGYNWHGAVAFVYAATTRAAPNCKLTLYRAVKSFTRELSETVDLPHKGELLPNQQDLARRLRRVYDLARKDPTNRFHQAIEWADAIPTDTLDDEALAGLRLFAVRVFWDIYPATIPLVLPPIVN